MDVVDDIHEVNNTILLSCLDKVSLSGVSTEEDLRIFTYTSDDTIKFMEVQVLELIDNQDALSNVVPRMNDVDQKEIVP